MNILVTGAAGFIGSHLAERLAQTGNRVCGLDCVLDNYARELKELNVGALKAAGVRFLPLDLATDELRDALDGMDLIYHLAAQPGLSASTPFETFARNNITATHRLLQAALSAPSVRGFAYISTSSVYGYDATGSEITEPRPTSHYGVTKLAGEQLVLAAARDRGFPGFSMRLFSVYGPRERPEKLYPRLIKAILEQKEFTLFDGSETHLRSFTFVSDIVDGLMSVAQEPGRFRGEIFNVGSDTAITTGEGIRIVEEILGTPAKLVRTPRRAGDQLKTHANIEKARRILGYAPRVLPREGLQKEVEWYRREIFEKGIMIPGGR